VPLGVFWEAAPDAAAAPVGLVEVVAKGYAVRTEGRRRAGPR
jgi:hypothetical protein